MRRTPQRINLRSGTAAHTAVAQARAALARAVPQVPPSSDLYRSLHGALCAAERALLSPDEATPLRTERRNADEQTH